MIAAAGLSPAWQQVLVYDGLHLGEVNRAQAAYWCASGKVLNVAVALHQLSGRRADAVQVVSTLGGPAYEPMDRELQQMGIARRWIRTASPTRVCTTLVDRRAGGATELVENAHPVTPAELAEFAAAFAVAAQHADGAVFTGSLPPGAPSSFVAELLTRSRGRIVLDIRGPELLAALACRPAIVKPNRAELAATLGRPLASGDDLRRAMRELLDRGAEAVVVTAGKEAVWLATPGGYQRFIPPAVDPVVNAIGCGDCFAAAVAWAHAGGGRLEDAIEQGLAAAAANLRTLLPGDLTGDRAQFAAR